MIILLPMFPFQNVSAAVIYNGWLFFLNINMINLTSWHLYMVQSHCFCMVFHITLWYKIPTLHNVVTVYLLTILSSFCPPPPPPPPPQIWQMPDQRCTIHQFLHFHTPIWTVIYEQWEVFHCIIDLLQSIHMKHYMEILVWNKDLRNIIKLVIQFQPIPKSNMHLHACHRPQPLVVNKHS